MNLTQGGPSKSLLRAAELVSTPQIIHHYQPIVCTIFKMPGGNILKAQLQRRDVHEQNIEFQGATTFLPITFALGPHRQQIRPLLWIPRSAHQVRESRQCCPRSAYVR